MKTLTTAEQLEAYASIVWAPDDLIEIRPLPAGKGTRSWVRAADLPSMAAALEADNLAGVNLYAGIMPRTRDGGGSAGDVSIGGSVWADFDDVDPREAWKIATAKGMPGPSMCVASGHGAHLFWALEAPKDADEISAVVKDLAALVGSDKSVADKARILRLPGFINHNPPAARAQLLFHSDARYSLEQLRAAVPVVIIEKAAKSNDGAAVGDSLLDRARRYVATIPGSGKGGRTNTAFRVAAACIHDFRLSDEQALEVAIGWDRVANSPNIEGDQLYPKGLAGIIRNARKHGKHSSGQLADKSRDRGPEFQHVARCKVGNTSDDITSMGADLEVQIAGEMVTLQMPWPKISEESRMLRPGTVAVIGGPTKAGKSFFVANICIGLQANGKTWRYLPLEDSRKVWGWRALAIVAENYKMIDDDQWSVNARAEALVKYGDCLQAIMRNVDENPRVGHRDESGATVVPTLPASSIIEWIREALRGARIVVVDPISQIEWSDRYQWREEADFVRKVVGIAADTSGTVLLVAHTSKRAGAAAGIPLGVEDVQGSAMFTRLVHTTLLIDAHEMKDSQVEMGSGFFGEARHNRTVVIAAARNGGGTRKRLAFLQRTDAPVFEECGILMPTKTKGRKQ